MVVRVIAPVTTLNWVTLLPWFPPLEAWLRDVAYRWSRDNCEFIDYKLYRFCEFIDHNFIFMRSVAL